MTDVVAIGWVTPTLLLTPPGAHERHFVFMDRLVEGAAGAVLHVNHAAAALIVSRRAVGPFATGHRWARLARVQERAVLVLGPRPRPADVDVHSYIRRYGTSAATLIVPVVPTADTAHQCEGQYPHLFSDEATRCGRKDTQQHDDGRWFCDEHQPTPRLNTPEGQAT